jgi:hypothetical protein
MVKTGHRSDADFVIGLEAEPHCVHQPIHAAMKIVKNTDLPRKPLAESDTIDHAAQPVY